MFNNSILIIFIVINIMIIGIGVSKHIISAYIEDINIGEFCVRAVFYIDKLWDTRCIVLSSVSSLALQFPAVREFVSVELGRNLNPEHTIYAAALIMSVVFIKVVAWGARNQEKENNMEYSHA